MSKSLKSNYIFNLINTGTQFLFPLITFPYATRIMGPDGIGIVNFYQSIISYVILIAGLGIPLYGVKEIARVRDNKKLLNQTTLEIFFIHLCLTIVAYLIIAILVLSVPRLSANESLFMLLSLSIVFTTIGCEWYYKGTEEFRYITVLGLIVKLLAMAFLFLFVHEKDDLLWYALFSVFVTVGSNLFNFLRLSRVVELKCFSLRATSLKRHVKPILKVFIFSVVTSLYLNLNPIILGFVSNDDAVGYYSTGLRLFTITSSIVGSLSIVMLPRISYLLSENKKEEFKNLTQKAFNFSVGLSLPLCVFLFFVSPYAIMVLCGSEFAPSIVCCQLLAPIIIFVAISSLMGTQVLYPMGEISTINRYCAIGAAIDILLSFLLVPFFAQIGTSIAYSVTEMVVMLLSIMSARKFIQIDFYNVNIKHYYVASLIMFIGLLLISQLHLNDILMIVIICVVGFVLYGGYLILIKDSLITNVLLSFFKINH